MQVKLSSRIQYRRLVVPEKTHSTCTVCIIFHKNYRPHPNLHIFLSLLPAASMLLRWKIILSTFRFIALLSWMLYLLSCLHVLLCVTWCCCCCCCCVGSTFSLVVKQFPAKRVKVGRISSWHSFNCTPTFLYPHTRILTIHIHTHTNNATP